MLENKTFEGVNKKPFFSVVIPTYNCAKFLKRSISSVLAQTFQDFELIVVDNSSTDETGAMLKKIDDPRISVIEVQNKGIIAYSRNIGLKRAQGEWVVFLDADDVWLSGKLETVNAKIFENPNVVLLCHNVWRVVYGIRKRIVSCIPSISNIHENLLFVRNCIVTSSVTLKRETAIRIGGFSERRDFVSVEDIDFWIRLSDMGQFCFIDKVLGEWHIHEDNGTKNVELHTNASIQMGEYHMDLWLKKYPGTEEKIRMGTARRFAGVSRALLKGKMFLKARQYAIKSIYITPRNWKAWAVLVFSILRIPI